MVKKELQRVTEMLEPVKGGHTLFGWGRYKRMLDHDLEDLGGKQSGGNDIERYLSGLLNKFTTMEYGSIFIGNYRVGVLHAGEAAMAFLSGHPVDTARALRTIITDATARKYAFLLAGRGMQASLGDGEKFAAAKWIDAHLNDPLLAKLEGLPNGKLIHQTLSAELPERLKTGASAVIAAEHVANDLYYPGGAQQLMADYLETASGGKIPTDRETALARAEVEVFRLRNRLIMHMPSATPISERTVFQRNPVGQLYFKMFRSVVQQARILSGYLDDASEAIVQKNPVKLGQALGRLAYAHVIVATLAGTATLPPYIWAAFDKTNKPTADLLRHLFNETRKHNALGGRELEEFGVKYVPAWAGINSFAPELGRQLVRNVIKGFGGDTDSQLKAAIVLTSGVLCDNIAHTEGLQNLQYLYNRINEGMKGEARVRFFLKPDLLKSVLGAHSQKIYDVMHKTDIPRGIWQFLLGGESANRAALHHQAEREYEEEHAE